MSERERERRRTQKQKCINTDVGSILLAQTESMRRELKLYVGGGKKVTRSDVVRLALRRLLLAFCAHQSRTGEPTQLGEPTWETVSQDICRMGICPDWLVPGPGDKMKEERS